MWVFCEQIAALDCYMDVFSMRRHDFSEGLKTIEKIISMIQNFSKEAVVKIIQNQ